MFKAKALPPQPCQGEELSWECNHTTIVELIKGLDFSLMDSLGKKNPTPKLGWTCVPEKKGIFGLFWGTPSICQGFGANFCVLLKTEQHVEICKPFS